MTLKTFLENISAGVSYTVGTEKGQGWVLYYDGKHAIEIPEKFLNREVMLIHPRESREPSEHCIGLNAGLAIILLGNEDGSI